MGLLVGYSDNNSKSIGIVPAHFDSNIYTSVGDSKMSELERENEDLKKEVCYLRENITSLSQAFYRLQKMWNAEHPKKLDKGNEIDFIERIW